MKIKAKCLFEDRQVNFKLTTGTYANFLAFLIDSGVYFLAQELILDYENIPKRYWGKGLGETLLDYISSNNENPALIKSFIHYFFSEIVAIKHQNGSLFDINIKDNTDWEQQQFKIGNKVAPYSVSCDSINITCDSYLITCDQI